MNSLSNKNPVANGVHTQAVSKKKYSSERPKKQHGFAEINQMALSSLPALMARWLPDGRMEGREYTARNPKRLDRHAGSFRINTHTGCWADFATGDKGGDIVSLVAYLFDMTQGQAKSRLAEMLGVYHG